MTPWQEGDKLLDHYEIKGVLKGGMGVVYIALDHEWDQLFAIKTFQDKFLWNEDITNRFIKEAETWVKLGMHTNIIQAEFVKKIHGKPYIFLEYIDGADLSPHIGNLSISATLLSIAQLCDGMEYAYNKLGVVHRDIKPANVMVTKNKIIKVTDFGLVKVLSDPDERGGPVGTLPYMAPEQFVDVGNVGVESDIYSTGIMLYEMLTGRLPFYTDAPKGFIEKHLRVIPKNPEYINPSIPKDLDLIVMQCLRKHPEDRYRSFKELKNDIVKIYETFTKRKTEIPEQDELSLGEVYFKGLSLAGVGKYEDAIECFDKNISRYSRHIDAWYNKGRCLMMSERYEDAVKCFNRAININPKYSGAWHNRGLSLYHLGKHEESVKCFDIAFHLLSGREIEKRINEEIRSLKSYREEDTIPSTLESVPSLKNGLDERHGSIDDTIINSLENLSKEFKKNKGNASEDENK